MLKEIIECCFNNNSVSCRHLQKEFEVNSLSIFYEKKNLETSKSIQSFFSLIFFSFFFGTLSRICFRENFHKMLSVILTVIPKYEFRQNITQHFSKIPENIGSIQHSQIDERCKPNMKGLSSLSSSNYPF